MRPAPRRTPLRHALGPTRPTRLPAPRPPGPHDSAWTAEKIRLILEAYRAFLHNAAHKHLVPADEVQTLVFDHICDPDDD